VDWIYIKKVITFNLNIGAMSNVVIASDLILMTWGSYLLNISPI